ncbi:hypothetical protein BDN67DRAFT_970677 [Paxillus ammoniavirescens]|nr:hypothetical protein BDN67DRAFT_970677 [Paxillus ammoniavirescens]
MLPPANSLIRFINKQPCRAARSLDESLCPPTSPNTHYTMMPYIFPNTTLLFSSLLEISVNG